MELTLEGKIITPILMKKTVFALEGCRTVIFNPKRRYITKSHKERVLYPFSFIGYLGKIRVTYRCKTIQEAKTKLQELLPIENIGRYSREGLGKIQWSNGKIGPRRNTRYHQKKSFRRVKIRKGLPHYLPDQIQYLVRYAMLHDFVHTPRHKSKIYIEVQVDGITELQQHHESSQNHLIQTFQKYDRIAASMTRKIRSPRTNRYTWKAPKKIDFTKLAAEIISLEKNIWRLYQYIYDSRELQYLNESLNHGHSSLRYHLLLIVNLIVRDYLRGKLS